MRPRLLAQLLFLGIVWGAAFLFIRVAVPEAGPLLLAELRVAIAAALLLAVGRRAAVAAIAAQPRAFVLVGLLFAAIPFTLLSRAGADLPAPLGAVLNATVPLFTVAGVAMAGRRAPSRRTAAGALLGLVGVAAVVGVAGLPSGPSTGAALVMALGAAACYGAAGIVTRRYLAPVAPLSLAFGQLGTAAILLAVPAVVSLPDQAPGSEAILAVAGLAVVSTAIAWPVYFRALAAAGPVGASVVTFVTPVFAILLGALLLRETLPPTALPGAAVLAIGVGLVLDLRLPGRPARFWARLRQTHPRSTRPWSPRSPQRRLPSSTPPRITAAAATWTGASASPSSSQPVAIATTGTRLTARAARAAGMWLTATLKRPIGRSVTARPR